MTRMLCAACKETVLWEADGGGCAPAVWARPCGHPVCRPCQEAVAACPDPVCPLCLLPLQEWEEGGGAADGAAPDFMRSPDVVAMVRDRAAVRRTYKDARCQRARLLALDDLQAEYHAAEQAFLVELEAEVAEGHPDKASLAVQARLCREGWVKLAQNC